MSMKQFDQWLRGQGAERRDDHYTIACRSEAKGEGDALTVVMSTGSADRHGDILDPAGIDTRAFEKNPVVLWAHKHDDLPIGRAGRVWSEDNTVMAEVNFDSRPFAKEVLRLYREGFLAGWSVGFVPKEWAVINDDNGKFSGYHVAKWELVELSAVPVPANPEALTRELSEGRIQAPALRKALDDALPQEKETDTPPPETDDSAFPSGGDTPPEITPRALAAALFPRLWQGVRTWAEAAALREIRRRQGRLD